MCSGRRRAGWKTVSHAFAYLFSIILTAWSGESPRLLLYAHGFSVLYKLITVWFFATAVEVNGSKGRLGELFSREPEPGDKSRSWTDSRTGKPAGIIGYVFAVFTLLFMVGIVLRMGGGPAFLRPKVLLPETGWALLIALVYLFDDLINKQIVVSSEKNVPRNLGYNVGGLNFLLAAIFISAFMLLITMNVVAWFFESQRPVIVVEWLIFLTLGIIRLSYDILKGR